MSKTIWIARDNDGELYLYSEKPELEPNDGGGMFCNKPGSKLIFKTHDLGCIEIDPDWYPEVTYENSPKKLIIDDIGIMEDGEKMEDDKKIFIRGSLDHGDKVIRYLEEHGGINPLLNGDGIGTIYFIDHDSDIYFSDMDGELAKVIMECYKEVTIDEVLDYFEEKENIWEFDKYHNAKGYRIMEDSRIEHVDVGECTCNHRNVFSTRKYAKSAFAMAQISQYMTNDLRYGGVVTDDEWKDVTTMKYVLYRGGGKILSGDHNSNYEFLAFHTAEQRDLFLTEHENLVKEYLMIE